MEKKSKKSLVIGITSLFLVTLVLLGLTYAYYRTRVIGNDSTVPSVSSSTKKMKIKYTDGTAVLSMNGNIEPGFTAEKRFSVSNVGTEPAYFNIIIDNVVNEFNKGIETRGEYYDWTYEVFKIENNNGVESLISLKSGDVTFDSIQLLVDEVNISSETVVEYKIVFKYKKLDNIDQSLDMGSKFSIRVNIGDDSIFHSWETPMEGTLLYYLKNNQPNGTEETIPGRETSTVNEARIVSTEDDYGTSYMYRGNVTNNYVNYSGMCWRILRIQGDGIIKLILADEHGECDASTYSVDNKLSGIVDGRTDLEIFDFDDVYVEWRNEKLNDNLLTTTEWCYDFSISENYRYFYDGTNYDDYYRYGAYSRLEDRSTANPSLKCDFVGLNNSKARKIKSKYDLLTADEIAFAGSYLGVNSQASLATLTPSHTGLEGTYYYNYNSMVDYYAVWALRPVIAIKKDVDAVVKNDIQTYGEFGTYTNPYVIK